MNKFFGALAGCVLLCNASAHAGQATGTLLSENFDGIPLGPNVEETQDDDPRFPLGTPGVWSATGPAGWNVDNSGSQNNNLDFSNPELNSGVPGAGNAIEEPGVKEWEGWSFARLDFFQAEGQSRQFFSLASGTVAVADPDEYDDDQSGIGGAGTQYYGTILTTPSIDTSAYNAGDTLYFSFYSSFRGEGSGDEGDDHQTAIVTISEDFGSSFTEVLRWAPNEIRPSTGLPDPGYQPTITGGNPTVNLFLDQAVLYEYTLPSGGFDANDGVDSIIIAFAMDEARNDWWWAIDDINVGLGAVQVAATGETSFDLGSGLAGSAEIIDAISLEAIGLGQFGELEVEVLGFSVFGSQAFTVTDFAATSLAPGESETFSIGFNAVAPGDYEGVIRMHTSAGNVDFAVRANVPEPATLVLAGMGAFAVVGMARRRMN
jgi:hypothetical protein